MMAAGFLASPLLTRREDVLDLYTGKAIIRPVGCAVELSPNTECFWQSAIRFRIYQLENPLGKRPSADVTPRLSLSSSVTDH